MPHTATNSNTTDRELRVSRLLNAPIDLVWEVWTNPEHIANWWGPNGFTNTIHTMHVKPGGEWELTMHGPDGTDYRNRSVFREVTKPNRLVYERLTGPHFIATATFTADGDKTHLDWHMVFDTAEEFRRTVMVFKADEGMKQNVVRLESYLIGIKRMINPSNTSPCTNDAPICLLFPLHTRMIDTPKRPTTTTGIKMSRSIPSDGVQGPLGSDLSIKYRIPITIMYAATVKAVIRFRRFCLFILDQDPVPGSRKIRHGSVK